MLLPADVQSFAQALQVEMSSASGGGDGQSDKSKDDKPEGDKSESDKPEGDKQASDKPEGDKPESDKPEGDKPASGPEGDKDDNMEVDQ